MLCSLGCTQLAHNKLMAGCCCDAASEACGAVCPQLETLTVEPLYLPVAVLHGICNKMPCLKIVALRNRHLTPYDKIQLGLYLDAVMCAPQHCLCLKQLVINLPEGVVVRSSPNLGPCSPLSLQRLECNCPVTMSAGYTMLIGMLSSLHLSELPCLLLNDLLQSFSLLQGFKLPRSGGTHAWWVPSKWRRPGRGFHAYADRKATGRGTPPCVFGHGMQGQGQGRL